MNLLFVCFLTLSSAGSVTYGPYIAYVHRVIDGDTIVVDVLIWPSLTQSIHLRLDDVNAPELHSKHICEKKAGAKAKLFVERWLQKSMYIIIDKIHQGKFAGRMLGKISHYGGDDLGDDLVEAGLAKEYHGGKRQPWCKDK